MYFNNLAEKLYDAPDYIIEYITKFQKEIRTNAKKDFRQILGIKTLLYSYKNARQEIKEEFEFLQNYIMSQQPEILKNRVPYERTMVMVENLTDETVLPTRYINRIGENIILVVTGSVTLTSGEFPGEFKMQAGEIWRYNSRVPVTYEYTPNFLGVVISYVDFDLTHYLMPFDVHGNMPRRRDEYADYDPNNDSHGLEKVSTNEY